MRCPNGCITAVVLSMCLATVFISYCGDNPADVEVTPEEISAAIPADLEHPYLFFTAREKPALLDRIENDRECRDIMNRMLKEAENLLDATVEPYREEERSDSFYAGRLMFLRRRRSAAQTLAFLYQMTGEKKYADKAYEYADVVCGVPDWVNGYHQFPIIHTRVWPWNVPDDQVNFSVDLEAVHTAMALAIVYDWLYPALDKSQRNRIRSALLEKVITRVRGNYEYHWWATAYRCNWCSVCNSGVGCSALALLKEEPRLVDVIAESFARISTTLDEVGDGGGWQEGVGYWRYMLGTSMEFGDALKRVTDGAFNLFEHPKVANGPVDFPLYTYLPPRGSVEFGDSGDRFAGSSYFYNKLSAETGCTKAAWIRENLYGDGTSMFDIIWPRSAVKPALPEQASHLFGTIHWAVLRSDFSDPENTIIACKAGYNDDPHHGHLDCGNFILVWRGEQFISELGRGSYDEGYFQETRWDVPHASSEGHNVVFVNGAGQESAKHKDRPWQSGIGGEILDFRSDVDRDYVLMEPTGAYPGTALGKWRRHIILDKPSVAVVLDEIAASTGSGIEIRFHSEARYVLGEGFVFLDGEEGDMAIIPVAGVDITLQDGVHRFVEAQGLTAKLGTPREEPYFGVVFEAERGTAVVATVTLPVDSEDDARTIAGTVERSIDSSGNCTVSFMAHGSEYSYVFRETPAGFVLNKREN